MKIQRPTTAGQQRRLPRRIPPRRVLQARAASSPREVEDYDGEEEPNMKLSHAFLVVLLLHVLAVGGIFAFNTLHSGRKAKEPVEAAKTPAVAEAAPAQSLPAAPPAKVQEPPSADAATHTVVAGQTLSRIATMHKTSVEAIEKANGLAAGSTIRVGQVLKLPSSATTKPSEVKPAVAPVSKATDQPKVVTKQEPAQTKVAETPKPTVAATSPAKTETEKPHATESAGAGGTYVVVKGDNPYSIAKKLKVSYAALLKANKIEDPTKLQIGQKLVIP